MGENKGMQTCPLCHQTKHQNRAGRIHSVSQRYRCMQCGCKYPPEPKQHGYPDKVRMQAVQLYVDGMNLRQIGRYLSIHHRTVSLWVKASAASLPEVPIPEAVKTADVDELFTFICNKKTGYTSSRL